MGEQLAKGALLAERGGDYCGGVMGAALKSPFPWFGGKRKVAHEVWARFGEVSNYVEPFFGSGAVLLGRPDPTGPETVNDKDGFVANFWRAVQHDPEQVANYADHPVNENDLHARHIWLVQQREELSRKLEGNPDFFDVKIAGYWVWGVSCWIGGGFCSGNGPWGLNDAGQLVHLGNAGQGVNRQLDGMIDYMTALSERLRKVRVCSGDWSRVCGPSVTVKLGLTGIFLDPPYADTANRHEDLYAHDCLQVAHDVREWAIEHGENPLLRIALCGYDGEHNMPEHWAVYAWNAGVGYGGQAESRTGNGTRERIWFSPACLEQRQQDLF